MLLTNTWAASTLILHRKQQSLIWNEWLVNPVWLIIQHDLSLSSGHVYHSSMPKQNFKILVFSCLSTPTAIAHLIHIRCILETIELWFNVPIWFQKPFFEVNWFFGIKKSTESIFMALHKKTDSILCFQSICRTCCLKIDRHFGTVWDVGRPLFVADSWWRPQLSKASIDMCDRLPSFRVGAGAIGKSQTEAFTTVLSRCHPNWTQTSIDAVRTRFLLLTLFINCENLHSETSRCEKQLFNPEFCHLNMSIFRWQYELAKNREILFLRSSLGHI